MPIVKNITDMIQKYSTKYDGANVTTTLTAVKPLMELRYESAMAVIYNVQEIVRSVLSESGVPTGQWAPYMAFGEMLAKLTFSHKGLTLQKEISGRKAYFVTAYKCDPKVIDSIVQTFLGSVPPY